MTLNHRAPGFDVNLFSLRTSFYILFLFISGALFSQALKTDFLTQSPKMEGDEIGSALAKLGWSKKNLEFVTDSHFVRRTWEIKNRKNGVKEYFTAYEFTKDTSENYVIYQFSEKAAYDNYKAELKNMGYKLISAGKQKKRKKNETYKEKDDLFYHEKNDMLTVVKDVFYYGLNSYMIYSYKPGSSLAKLTIATKSTSDH